MSVTIPFPPEIEQRLRERAAAVGQDVNTFVREAVEEKLSTGTLANDVAQLSKQQWFEKFDEWMREVAGRASMYPPGYEADDSRESIYEGRGE